MNSSNFRLQFFQISEFKFQTNITNFKRHNFIEDTLRDTTSFKTSANYSKLSNQMKVIKEHHEEEEEERHLKSYILSHDVAMHSTVTEQNFMFNYHILDKYIVTASFKLDEY
jgi:hypothetical protein